MKIKLGIAPIAWSNDDMPELGGDTPIEQCLEEASSAGFTGIELGGKFPRNPGLHDRQLLHLYYCLILHLLNDVILVHLYYLCTYLDVFLQVLSLLKLQYFLLNM